MGVICFIAGSPSPEPVRATRAGRVDFGSVRRQTFDLAPVVFQREISAFHTQSTGEHRYVLLNCPRCGTGLATCAVARIDRQQILVYRTVVRSLLFGLYAAASPFTQQPAPGHRDHFVRPSSAASSAAGSRHQVTLSRATGNPDIAHQARAGQPIPVRRKRSAPCLLCSMFVVICSLQSIEWNSCTGVPPVAGMINIPHPASVLLFSEVSPVQSSSR